MKVTSRVCTTSSSKKVEVQVVESNYHVEVTPSDVGIYDKLIIQDLIKEMAQTMSLPTTSNSATQSEKAPIRFKTVVIHMSNALSKDAQSALRRTMEIYSKSIRFILVAEGLGGLMSPIKSRCCLVRIPGAQDEEIEKVLKNVASMENITVTPPLLKEILSQANGNLRTALLLLESSKYLPANAPSNALVADYKQYITKIAMEMLSSQTPQTLLSIRTMFYELLSHCIPSTVIHRELVFEVIKRVDDSFKHSVVEWGAEFEVRSKKGGKEIVHLEAFTAKVMCLYRAFLDEMEMM
ncbi:Replication factor C (RF-C) subunit [Nowakowskiella sp. JEL0407]|nr:Replication factor C (RF-C) subunit [Nowakowskiella sp. JEL0407]